MLMRKMGLKTKGLDSNVADKSLREERQTYTRQGKKEPGFTSSIVPTLEEKVIMEKDHSENGNGYFPTMQNDAKLQQQIPANGKAGDELLGVPAHGDLQNDTKVPGSSTDPGDADSEEERAPGARSTIRTHLNAKLGSKAWTLPTPTPHVDPHGFDDPISDKFWKGVWVACAVHNVNTSFKLCPNIC